MLIHQLLSVSAKYRPSIGSLSHHSRGESNTHLISAKQSYKTSYFELLSSHSSDDALRLYVSSQSSSLFLTCTDDATDINSIADFQNRSLMGAQQEKCMHLVLCAYLEYSFLRRVLQHALSVEGAWSHLACCGSADRIHAIG